MQTSIDENSLYSVGHKSGAIQPSALTDSVNPVPIRGEQQLLCQWTPVGLVPDLPVGRELGRRRRVHGSRRLHPLQLDGEACVLGERSRSAAPHHPQGRQVSSDRRRR